MIEDLFPFGAVVGVDAQQLLVAFLHERHSSLGAAQQLGYLALCDRQGGGYHAACIAQSALTLPAAQFFHSHPKGVEHFLKSIHGVFAVLSFVDEWMFVWAQNFPQNNRQ